MYSPFLQQRFNKVMFPIIAGFYGIEKRNMSGDSIRSMSSGSGAVKTILAPVTGWVKVSRYECRAWREMYSISGL